MRGRGSRDRSNSQGMERSTTRRQAVLRTWASQMCQQLTKAPSELAWWQAPERSTTWFRALLTRRLQRSRLERTNSIRTTRACTRNKSIFSIQVANKQQARQQRQEVQPNSKWKATSRDTWEAQKSYRMNSSFKRVPKTQLEVSNGKSMSFTSRLFIT